MGRLDKYNHSAENLIVHDDNISSVLSDLSEKPRKIVLFDADGLAYHALHEKKDENGNKPEPYTIDNIDAVMIKLDEIVKFHLENIEKYFTIDSLFMFIGGRDNYRKEIYPEYKDHRTQNELVPLLLDHLEKKYSAIRSHGYEADDYIFSASLDIHHEGIVVTIDSDLNQIPGIHYNYQKRWWYEVSVQESYYNLAYKLIVGDVGDGVNLSPKVGKKYAENHLTKDMSVYSYIKTVYNAYLKAWKKDSKLAKEKLRLAYKLIKLQYIR